jgi:hypothetical protein
MPPVLGFCHVAESGIIVDVLSAKTELLQFMQGCVSQKPRKKSSRGNPLVQNLKAGHLPTGLVLHTALKILVTIHCCFENR